MIWANMKNTRKSHAFTSDSAEFSLCKRAYIRGVLVASEKPHCKWCEKLLAPKMHPIL